LQQLESDWLLTSLKGNDALNAVWGNKDGYLSHLMEIRYKGIYGFQRQNTGRRLKMLSDMTGIVSPP
jgi:hypothetical protein